MDVGTMVRQSETGDVGHRLVLLRECMEPQALARALSTGRSAPVGALDSAKKALARRGLVPVIPERCDFPSLLLVNGCLPSMQGVAIVGARATDPYGVACARYTAEEAVSLGRAVISGGAEGCDAHAHRAALECGGQTVVVLASGHDHPYPAHHRALFQQIVEKGGAVVSPFWPTVRPARYRFLIRNRVIAALAAVTVVVRARQKSGSLHTARAASTLGRPVMAVPGNVGVALSEGCNHLISEGALPMLGPSALASVLGAEAVTLWPSRHLMSPSPWCSEAMNARQARSEALQPEHRGVLEKIRASGTADFETLAMDSELSMPRLTVVLMELEMAGQIHAEPGQRYSIC